MSRTECLYNLASLLNEGTIATNDLEELSGELKEKMTFLTGHC